MLTIRVSIIYLFPPPKKKMSEWFAAAAAAAAAAKDKICFIKKCIPKA